MCYSVNYLLEFEINLILHAFNFCSLSSICSISFEKVRLAMLPIVRID